MTKLNDEDPQNVYLVSCNPLLTLEHILISRVDFDIIHQNFYTASKL